jgi:very-short-patch-repair endonuclease
MREQIDTADAAVARIAGRQHGVVSYTQLIAAGLDKSAIARRVAAGRLHRIFRGVYAVGHAGLGNEGRWMAAVLACGEGAALTHRSAAELWGMLKPVGGPVHVMVAGAGGRMQRTGICVHRSRYLTQAVTTLEQAILVTTPARTLADLRRTVTSVELRRAVRQAEFRGLAIGQYQRESEGTRSELERRFLRLCRHHRLPEPEVNAKMGPFTVDFLWRRERLIVETDGYASHRGRQAFEDDRTRDNELMALGYDVLRFTYARVVSEPARVAAIVRARLASCSRYPRTNRQ